MNVKRIGLLAASIAFLAGGALADNGRSAYTYVRESTGEVTVVSSLNGEVEARRKARRRRRRWPGPAID